LILFSSLARFANAKYLIKVKHLSRMSINSIIMMIGFLLISFACTFNQYEASFFLSLVSSVLLGTVSAFGESTTLGFCKGLPSTVVGYFGSGTGFAGVFGSGITLILQSAGLDNGKIFFIITPTVVPYFLSFWWLNRMKAKYPYVEELKPIMSAEIETSPNYQSVASYEQATNPDNDKQALVNSSQ